MFHVPNEFRIREGKMRSMNSYGNNGAFLFKHLGRKFYVIASDGLGWEHVSVSVVDKNRCPTWEQMCYVKDLFWDPEDIVLQIHPPKSVYVNTPEFTLHLWRNPNQEFQLPFKDMK